MKLISIGLPGRKKSTEDAWVAQHGVQLHVIQLGNPMQNAFIESLNVKFRDECLNERWFLMLQEAQLMIEAWRIDYNEHRPHGSLGDLTPQEFVEQAVSIGLQEAANFQHGMV